MSTPRPAYRNPEFDQYAEDYDHALQQGLAVSGESRDYFAHGRVEILRECLRSLKFRPRSILDFGCGTGASTPWLLGLDGAESLLGLEVSAGSIKLARKQHGSEKARFELIDDYQPAGAIDLAFCNGVFHHIPPAERARAARCVFDSLRPGGLFALWENNPWNPGTRYVMSRIPFDKEAITLSILETKRLLRAAGFELIRSDFAFIFPSALAWLRPLEALARKLPLGAQYQVLARKKAG